MPILIWLPVYFLTSSVNPRLFTLLISKHAQHPVAATPKAFDLTSSAFLLVAFLTGIAGALQTPTLSLFLTDEVHARPGMVGFFFTGSAVIGILVSRFWLDVQIKRRSQKPDCVLLRAGDVGLRAVRPGTVTILFCYLSGYSSAVLVRPPTRKRLLAREHADRTGREAVMFSSILRAGFAGLGDWRRWPTRWPWGLALR